eukprot:8404649-Lingulodinium_polyedra.AAC.1
MATKVPRAETPWDVSAAASSAWPMLLKTVSTSCEAVTAWPPLHRDFQRATSTKTPMTSSVRRPWTQPKESTFD